MVTKEAGATAPEPANDHDYSGNPLEADPRVDALLAGQTPPEAGVAPAAGEQPQGAPPMAPSVATEPAPAASVPAVESLPQPPTPWQQSSEELYQQIEQQRLENERQADLMADMRRAEELRTTRLQLETAGYDAGIIANHLAQLQGLHQREATAEKIAKHTQRRYEQALANEQARLAVASHFAGQCGTPVKEFLNCATPKEMEWKAKHLLAQKELDAMKQAKAPPQKFAGSAPQPSKAQGKDEIIRRYGEFDPAITAEMYREAIGLPR